MDVRIGCYCLIVTEGRILLTHWNAYGRSGWTLPGGGMEGRESVEETCVRECREETGLDVEPAGLLGVDTRYIAADDRADPTAANELRALRVVHRARVVGGRLTDEVDGSSDGAAWFALDELPADRLDLVDLALRWSGDAGQ